MVENNIGLFYLIQTYNKTTSMVAFKSSEHMREASRVLNVLYVYDRSYEPYLIHWLFPLQIAFQNSSEKTTEKGTKQTVDYCAIQQLYCFII